MCNGKIQKHGMDVQRSEEAGGRTGDRKCGSEDEKTGRTRTDENESENEGLGKISEEQ